MTEPYKKFITTSIWVAILLFVIRSSMSWDELSLAVTENRILDCGYLAFSNAGEAIGLSAIFMGCFNRWLWKWKPFNLLSGGIPVLAKRYKGKIRFKNNKLDQEQEAEILIEQTFLNIIVKLNTIESSSSSIAAMIETINNEKQLVYTYLNTPRAEIQDRNTMHFGTAILKIYDTKHLIGNYYTERLSRGSMDFEAIE